MALKSGKEIADTLDKFPSKGKAKMSASFTMPKATMPGRTSSNTTQDKMDAPWGGRKYSGPSWSDVKPKGSGEGEKWGPYGQEAKKGVNLGRKLGEIGKGVKEVVGDFMSDKAEAQPAVTETKGDRQKFQGRITDVPRVTTMPREKPNRGKMKKSAAPAVPLPRAKPERPKTSAKTSAKKQNFTGAFGAYQGGKGHDK